MCIRQPDNYQARILTRNELEDGLNTCQGLAEGASRLCKDIQNAKRALPALRPPRLGMQQRLQRCDGCKQLLQIHCSSLTLQS